MIADISTNDGEGFSDIEKAIENARQAFSVFI